MHAPLLPHMHVPPVHANCPSDPQYSTSPFAGTHVLCPGPHTPVHVPDTQVVLASHVVPLPHCPFVPHACGVCPSHRVCPGAQTPVHAPDTHVWSLHVAVDAS